MANLKPGTYKDKDGKPIVVRRTETGYVVRRADGSTTVIGGGR